MKNFDRHKSNVLTNEWTMPLPMKIPIRNSPLAIDYLHAGVRFILFSLPGRKSDNMSRGMQPDVFLL
jgi:hypothetical protein